MFYVHFKHITFLAVSHHYSTSAKQNENVEVPISSKTISQRYVIFIYHLDSIDLPQFIKEILSASKLEKVLKQFSIHQFQFLSFCSNKTHNETCPNASSTLITTPEKIINSYHQSSADIKDLCNFLIVSRKLWFSSSL